MSRKERQQLRPARDLNVIKPRSVSRADIDAAKGVSPPDVLPAEVLQAVLPVSSYPIGEGSNAAAAPVPDSPQDAVFMKRRKRHRRSRHGQMVPKSLTDKPESFLSRLFGR